MMVDIKYIELLFILIYQIVVICILIVGCQLETQSGKELWIKVSFFILFGSLFIIDVGFVGIFLDQQIVDAVVCETAPQSIKLGIFGIVCLMNIMNIEDTDEGNTFEKAFAVFLNLVGAFFILSERYF